MRKLSTAELNRPTAEEYGQKDKLPVIVVLDNIRSHNNTGSVFRTADAFLIDEIYLCGITACPPHRDIHKTALGAEESVKWRYFDTTIKACQHLKQSGYRILAVEQTEGSTMLQDFIFKGKTAIVMGNEVEGVSDEVIEMCDGSIELPQSGTKHSLNVSVCSGIVMWKAYEDLFLGKNVTKTLIREKNDVFSTKIKKNSTTNKKNLTFV